MYTTEKLTFHVIIKEMSSVGIRYRLNLTGASSIIIHVHVYVHVDLASNLISSLNIYIYVRIIAEICSCSSEVI